MQKHLYTIRGTANLPTLGDRIGKGGNAPVYLCYITTPSGETLTFACKVEQMVSSICSLYPIITACQIYVIYNYRNHYTRTPVCLRKCVD